MASKAAPKLGVPVHAEPLVVTDENPDDFIGDRYVHAAAPVVEQPKPSGFIRRAADYALSGLQGAIGVPQAAVGLADLATGGRVGKALENEGSGFGFRPEEANAYLESLKSPEQQASSKAVQDASQGQPGDDQGLLSKIGRVVVAALEHPSVIAHSVVQSLPAMGAGGVIGRGLLWASLSATQKAAILALPAVEQAGAIAAAAPRLAGLAGGVGEGVTTMGQQAEQIRTDEHNPSRVLSPSQAAWAAGTGAVTGLIGMGSGKLAQKLGIENAENLLAGVHADPVAKQSLVRRVIGGAVTEGLLEELPQSVQEQVGQNMATGQPWDAGVDQAAVLGVLSGGAMGIGAQAFHREPAAPLAQPNLGPLSRAANIAQAGVAAGAPVVPPAAPEAPTAPTAPTAPLAPVSLTPEQSQQLLDMANKRMAALMSKEAGTPEYNGPDGKTIPEVPKQFLTPEEKSERDFLKQAGGDVQALVRAYGPPVQPAKPIDDNAVLGRMEKQVKREDGEAAGIARATEDDELLQQAEELVQQSGKGSVAEVQRHFRIGYNRAQRLLEALQQKGVLGPMDPATGARALAKAPTAPTAPEAPTAPLAPAANGPTEEDLPLPHQDDILNPQGQPFKERFAAKRAATRQPDPESFQIVQVQGGYALRRTAALPQSEGVSKTGSTPAPTGNVATPAPAPAPAEQGPSEADILDSDILNPAGEPFKNKAAALVAQKKAGDGHALVQVPTGWVVRPQPTTMGKPGVEVQPAGTRGTNAGDVVTVDEAAHGAATSPENDLPEPTDEQKKAGNYQKGHVSLGGLDLSVENPAGSERSGTDANGKRWTNTLQHHYGYIRGTLGNDGDHVDAFVKPGTPLDYSGPVYVVDQQHPETGIFDEHKALIGFDSEDEAKAAYASNYAKDWQGLKAVTAMPFSEFKSWVKDGHKNEPLQPQAFDKAAEPAPEQEPQQPEGGNVATPESEKAQPQGPGTPPGDAAPTEPKSAKNQWADSTPEQRREMLRAAGYTDGDQARALSGSDWDGLPDTVRSKLEPAPAGGTPAEPSGAGAATGGPGTPTGEATPVEPKEPKAPKAPRKTKAEREAEAAEALRADYFTPGNIVKSYGGHDRVVAYTPPDENGRWSVKVREVIKSGDKWTDAPNAQERQHSTQPSEKGLEAGPVERAPIAPKPEKKAKAEKPPADSMAELIDGTDINGIADKVYEGIREAAPEDFPVVLADDKIIRLPVLIAEREKVEANLKKLGFRITDRAQESGTDGRLLISAIYRPEKGSIGDVGEQMAGGRKEQNPIPSLPKDADEKALDAFLESLHKGKYLDPDANAEQSFGAMMLKEAIMENVQHPPSFISGIIRKSFRGYWREDKPRDVLTKAMKDDVQRARVQELAAEYMARLQKLQDVLTPANRVADVRAAFEKAYTEERYGTRYMAREGDAPKLVAVSDRDPYDIVERMAPKFEPTEDTTDQTHRAKKKDPDTPPRLERIVRVGMKDHRGGKPVADDDFLNTFKFRGLEFGNWVNQAEREANLNLAYDSLRDLADLTGLKPETLGLMQSLGFAIGSRGRSPRAAAHFEPDNNVINLTKTKGNGAVGHEWFHALDHNASNLQTLEGQGSAKQAARVAVNELAEALKMRVDVERADNYLRGLLRQTASDSSRNTPPKEAVLEAIRGSQRYRYSTPQAYLNASQRTSFQTSANAMDEGASKPYWGTPVEMLARGFETLLYDKSKGGTPYLVGPSRADGAMTPKNGYKGTPYPQGKERAYVVELFQTFIDQLDPDTLALKSYAPEYTIKEVPGMGWTALDQHGIDLASADGRMTVFKTEEAARQAADAKKDAKQYLTVGKQATGRLNTHFRDFASRIDAIMEEMGLERWPEVKDGSMADSMFFHLRQGWWPKDNAALKAYVAKAFRIEAREVDLLKLKQAQEDFEAALARYAGQRIVDLRTTGSDDKAIYDYLVDLYNKQPNLDVRTSSSTAAQQYSTPLPIAFVGGILGRVTSKSAVFDATGGNGLLTISANPKRVLMIELDPHRAKNLRLMEYGRVIEGDALVKMDDIRAQEADVNLFNPPFGSMDKSVAVPSWDGREYLMSKIDQTIAAEGMKAMANQGRAVILLGAHRNAGTVTSSDRVFLNWLYNNYHVADHFEIDGGMYSRQGANWPLRVLVVAGRNQTSGAYPVGQTVDRVYDFDQLWSRTNEARTRSEQVVVGAGIKPDSTGSGNPVGAGLLAGDQGQAASAGEGGGSAGSGAGIGDGNDGVGRPGNSGDGRPGQSGGATAGDGQRGGSGAGGGAVAGGTGQPGGRGNSGRGAVGTPTGGLSGLTDDDIDELINSALGGNTPRAPKGAGTTTGEPGGNVATGEKAALAPKPGKPKLGKSILDDIPGLEGLFGDLQNALAGNDDETPPPEPPKGKKKREPALTRRDRLIAQRQGESATEPAPEAVTNFFAPKEDAPLLLGYTPNKPGMTGNDLDVLSGFQASQKTLARSIQAALDYQTEQQNNPTAPAEQVSSRAMFSRQMQEDQQYGKVQPILSAIWQHLSKAIADVGQRIKTFVIGAAQKFGNAVVPLVKRFIQEVRQEEAAIPSGKKPIRAEAIDNEAQVVYRGRSTGDSGGIFVPRNQAQALDRAFDAFEAENGEVDPFVMKELGYASIEDMHKGPKRGQSQGLAGYQVDALALAIGSMKRGDGFIIGDDTGVGKGRTAAALIGWAVKNGKVPIFFSYKKDLYSAMYDDITDIGMEDRVRPLVSDGDAVIRTRAGKTVLKSNDKSATAALKHIIATGTMPEGHNALFTTYYQVNVPNKRRDAIARLVRDGKAVLIMDEAHNSAGDSSTNKFFMGLLTGQTYDKDGNTTPAPDDFIPPQTTYLTATYAKRPSNMPVYIRTQLRHAANTPQELVGLFSTGGDVLQQIASEMLVSSGSMIRRERSYAGVKFNYVTDEENAPRDSREVDAATMVLRQIVYADRAFSEWVKSGEGQDAVKTLAPPGFVATFSGSGADVAINHSEFTSVVHNYVGQLLLATKVNKAVELAVKALNDGQKPVLTLQNTMEAALNDYVGMGDISEGDALPGFGWQSILGRGLTSARRVVFDAGTGNKKDNIRVMVPVEYMPPLIAAEFHRAQGLIEQFKSNLPGSPIDALRQRLGQYHIIETKGADGQITYSATTKPPEGAKSRPLIAVEVTGREMGVDYSQPTPTYMRRQDPDNLEIIRGFQNGGIDVVILNSSGSTGISLHASEMARDQRPRHMLVMQPNPDIAVFKQTTGRIHRTGQVEWPTFTVLATGIPAERRQLAMLAKKIGSLFSNTSSGKGTTEVDAVDFLNQYGDKITAQYLEDNEDVAKFVGLQIPNEPEGSDIAKKASGRAALLSVDEQRDYFDTIEQQFQLEIEQRNATGTNALARRALDFQASPVEMQTLEEGMDEDNPFTASAYLTKYEINVIGDVPTPEKVRDAIASALQGGKPQAATDRLVASLATRYDEARNQLLLRQQEIAASIADAKATEQEKAAFTERQASLKTIIDGFAARREKTIDALNRNLAIGNGVRMMKVGDVESSAVVVGVTAGKSTSKVGNPFSPSNIIIHFQRNVPSGRLSVPLSKIESEEYETNGWTRQPDIEDWFALRAATGGRIQRYIATGNLLRARSIVNGGEIMLHTLQGSTEATPRVQGGILMPAAYAPGSENKSDFTIRYPAAAIDYVLSLEQSVLAQRAERSSYDDLKEKADALKAAAKFPVDIPADKLAEIVNSGPVLFGPARGWMLEMSRYDGGLRLYVKQKAFPKLNGSKDLIAAIGKLAKKRSNEYFEGPVPADADTIKKVVRILSQHSPLVAPDAGADIARDLSRQHFREDNGTKPDADQAGGAPMASRSMLPVARGGQPAAQVQALVTAITARWTNAPRIVVVQSLEDPKVPANVRAEAHSLKSQGSSAGEPEGFFNPADKSVYLVADQLGGDADTLRVLLHESLGHFGLRGTFGAEIGTILDRMATLNPGKVRDAAKQLGYDYDKPSERRLAAEEVLAYMAQSAPELGWVQRTVAAVRTWLREHVPGFSRLGLSDAEIVRDYILPARNYVKGGGPRGGGNVATDRPTFSRPLAAAMEQGLNSVREVKLPAGYVLGDLFNSVGSTAGRLNWWHKTVGTMHNLAERSPDFKRTYDAVQNFLGDVSYYATEAADLAPRILPKLESWKDITKSPLSPEDTKAVSAPIFEGTLTWGRDERGVARPSSEIEQRMGAVSLDDKAHKLLRAGLVDAKVLRMWQGLPMDQYESIIEGKFEREMLKPGVVFTPEELKKHFGLTDRQVSLYQEFRKAIDKSLTNLAISDMLRYGGADTASIRDQVLAAPDVVAAGDLLRDKLFALAAADPARADVLNETGNKMVEKSDRAKELMEHGYAPLSRFGQYTLDVLDHTGKRVYFSLFESPAERSKMARQMAAQFPGATIQTGTVSEEAYKLFAGVSPETLELFGGMLGLESEGNDEASKAFQTYLKLAKNSRSSMKRLIERKGIAGFSEDAGRVLAGFVYSNARQTSSNLHMKEIDKSITDIPKGDGQLQDAAVQMRDYVKNPTEEAQALRGILFAQYLGGSIASAMVNATQPIAVTLPYLSQFGGPAKAARQMVAAFKDATRKTTGDAALDAALKHAEEEGIVSPQEVHGLMAQAMGRAQLKGGDGTFAGNAVARISNAQSKLSLAWGKVFGVAEQYNRRVTFIAAYRTAVANGNANPAKFAAHAVADTQFTYNKGSKPKWARGAFGSVLFTFKQYSINYVELLHRMATAGEPGSPERAAGQRAVLLALAVLFLMGGADGLPFAQDIEDVIDGAMQRLGYNFSSKQQMKSFLAAQLGKGGADFVQNGVSGLPGMPIDVSGRMGMGNLIPGTGLLQKKADHGSDLLELAGPAGDLGKRVAQAGGKLTQGDVLGAAKSVSAVSVQNLAKAYDMATTGMYRDDRGYKVIDTTPGEALAKAIGFQPHSVHDVQDATREVQREKSQYAMVKAEIASKWAQAMFGGDKEAIQAARDDVAQWNAQNPTLPMKPDMPGILRRVREMRMSKDQRVAATAPKAIRAQVRQQLAEEMK